MIKIVLFTLLLISGSAGVYARGIYQGGQHLNYGFTLMVVAIIAAYSAKLVADKQKQAKKNIER